MTFENTKWAERLNYLATLEDGWYDGNEKAISQKALQNADKVLNELDSDTFCVPGLFPSLEEGDGIALEWVNSKRSRETGDFRDFIKASLYISNEGSYDLSILDHWKDSAEDTNLETKSYDEALTFLRSHLTRLGFYTPSEEKGNSKPVTPAAKSELNQAEEESE